MNKSSGRGGFIVKTRGANDASRVRVQLSSSRVVNISSRAYSSQARLDSLTFRVELELESSLLESSSSSSRARARVELTRVQF